jgi:hypothetical protein
MNRLTTDRDGNIYLNKVATGWGIKKVNGGWVTVNFDDEISAVYKTKKEALACTGLDW